MMKVLIARDEEELQSVLDDVLLHAGCRMLEVPDWEAGRVRTSQDVSGRELSSLLAANGQLTVAFCVSSQNGYPAGHKAVRTIRDLSIDLSRCEVYVGAKRVDLTHRKFQIISLLSETPGKVYSSDSIIEAIWGHEYLGESISIPTYIRHIREKVEDDPASPRYVQTARHYGYRLCT